MDTVPGVVRVSRTKRKPPWKPAVTRPGARGCRVSGPPDPARPGASSEAGAPGVLDTTAPVATLAESAGANETVFAWASNAVMVRACASEPAPKGIRLPTSRFAVDASVTWVAPAGASAAAVVDAGWRRPAGDSPVTRTSVGAPDMGVTSKKGVPATSLPKSSVTDAGVRPATVVSVAAPRPVT